MAKYISHGLSIIIILIALLSLAATTAPVYPIYEDTISYIINDEQLEIRIKTNIKPTRRNYRVDNGIFIYNFDDKVCYHFTNKGHGILEETGYKYTQTGRPVFSTNIDGDYFVIYIDNKYLGKHEIKQIDIKLDYLNKGAAYGERYRYTADNIFYHENLLDEEAENY